MLVQICRRLAAPIISQCKRVFSCQAIWSLRSIFTHIFLRYLTTLYSHHLTTTIDHVRIINQHLILGTPPWADALFSIKHLATSLLTLKWNVMCNNYSIHWASVGELLVLTHCMSLRLQVVGWLLLSVFHVSEHLLFQGLLGDQVRGAGSVWGHLHCLFLVVQVVIFNEAERITVAAVLFLRNHQIRQSCCVLTVLDESTSAIMMVQIEHLTLLVELFEVVFLLRG